MSWIWSALMPHPPVLIPEVGRGRENEASKTLEGIERLTSSISGERPEVLFVLSPHQPYAPGALFINTAESYRGSFAVYGASDVKINAVSSGDDIDALSDVLSASGTSIYRKPFADLSRDQGSTVPLYFLERTWGSLPNVIIASPIGLSPEEAFSMGPTLAKIQSGKRWALLASGDLSHRMTPDAPAGYEPEYAPVFESAVEEALKTCSPSPLLGLNRETLERAGECGLRSVMAMLGLAGSGRKIDIFSHEWPFGVGYCTALWRE